MALESSKPVKKRDDTDKGKLTIVKNAADLQRLKLEKLMKNPEKPVVIPERPKEKGMPHVPEFVRNVMGSSAGAGSGEFHVYRHLRRKEYARQKFIQEKAEKETLEEQYHRKIEENRLKAEAETAKKRAKRLKKKNRKLKKPRVEKKSESVSEDESDEEDTSGKEEEDGSEKITDKNTKHEPPSNVEDSDSIVKGEPTPK